MRANRESHSTGWKAIKTNGNIGREIMKESSTSKSSALPQPAVT